MKGFKIQITLQVTFCKEIETDQTKHPPPSYFNAETQTVVNDLGIDNTLNTSYLIIF